MEEQPNLEYLHNLSRGNKEFEAKLLKVFKLELPEEKTTYLTNIKFGDLQAAASNVHKLKHKIGILGLEASYRFAESYEEELRNNESEKHPKFVEILQKMVDFIVNL